MSLSASFQIASAFAEAQLLPRSFSSESAARGCRSASTKTMVATSGRLRLLPAFAVRLVRRAPTPIAISDAIAMNGRAMRHAKPRSRNRLAAEERCRPAVLEDFLLGFLVVRFDFFIA